MPPPSFSRLAYSLVRRVGWISLLASLLVLSPSTATGQVVRATVSADSVYIGEPFTLSVIATHRFSAPASFPSVPADTASFGDLDALEQSAVNARDLGADDPGARVDSVAYVVTTFALDTARVPPLTVRIAADNDTLTLTTSPLRIPVRSTVPADAEGLRGLTPLASFPASSWPWMLLTLTALALLAGLAYAWYRYRTAPDEERLPSAPSPPPIPPYEAACQQLDALEQETDWTRPEDLEVLFVELATILRRYIAHRMTAPALERTTGEIIHMLRAVSTLPREAVDAVEQVLTRADLVKFADRRPTGREARTALKATRATLDAIERALPALTNTQDSAPQEVQLHKPRHETDRA